MSAGCTNWSSPTRSEHHHHLFANILQLSEQSCASRFSIYTSCIHSMRITTKVACLVTASKCPITAEIVRSSTCYSVVGYIVVCVVDALLGGPSCNHMLTSVECRRNMGEGHSIHWDKLVLWLSLMLIVGCVVLQCNVCGLFSRSGRCSARPASLSTLTR